MIDPGSLGTLLIGLEHIRTEEEREQQDRRRRPSSTRPARTHAIRLALARTLRRAAATLEPATTREVAG